MTAVISPRLLRAYRLTRYCAAGVEIRIGRRAPDVLFLHVGAPSAALITAWNPQSRRMPDGWNYRMQRRLCEHLRRCSVLPAEGVLRRWREAHLLAAGDPRWVQRIARRFRQRGIILLRRGQRAHLALLPQPTADSVSPGQHG